MKVYSEATVSFALKCEALLKDIIKNECHFKIRRTRFEWNHYTYPVQIVIITSTSKLGYFDHHTYQIGLNQNLMYTVKDDVLKNILRHEFAHYLTYLTYPEHRHPHGDEFKEICEIYKWNDSISKASLNIDLANETIGNLESEKIIHKIKSLLKLSESDNQHEAEQATLYANKLLLKHNIKSLHSHDKILFVETVLTSKKRSAKLSSIYDILKNFLVKPVLIYGKKQVSIEVTGSFENIELAKYIASFLDAEFERLWLKQTHLKGMRAKNSFFLGISHGYNQKINSVQKEFSTDEKKALIVIKKDLDERINQIYRRLSGTTSTRTNDKSAYSAGESAGKKLTINQAIKNTKNILKLNWSQS